MSQSSLTSFLSGHSVYGVLLRSSAKPRRDVVTLYVADTPGTCPWAFGGLPVLPIWLLYILPVPVLVLLVLLPGIAYRVARRGRLKESELHVRWPWWRRPPS